MKQQQVRYQHQITSHYRHRQIASGVIGQFVQPFLQLAQQRRHLTPTKSRRFIKPDDEANQLTMGIDVTVIDQNDQRLGSGKLPLLPPSAAAVAPAL